MEDSTWGRNYAPWILAGRNSGLLGGQDGEIKAGKKDLNYLP